MLKQNTIKQVKKIFEKGGRPFEAAAKIRDLEGLGRSQSFEWAKRILEDDVKLTDNPPRGKAEVKYAGDIGNAECIGQRVKSLDDLVEACNIDLDIWAIKSHIVNAWETNTKDGIKTVFQVKAFLESKKQANYIKTALSNWTPPKLKSFKSVLHDERSDKIYLVGLSDNHFGAKANGKYMYSSLDWTTEDTVKAVDKYIEEITKDVLSRKYKFKECVVLSTGDVFHSVSGKTGRGTELKYDIIKQEMFDKAFSSYCVLIQRLTQLFGNVRVADIGGNHNYELDMALFRGLAAYFHTDSRIKFEHLDTFPSPLIIGSTLILAHHGQHFEEKTHVPKDGKSRENYIQSLFLQRPELLKGIKTKLFIQGDKHHFEHVEYHDFEFIMLSTSLAGDEHSSVNNWKNRARQSCLVLDNTGLREIIHTYFDEK